MLGDGKNSHTSSRSRVGSETDLRTNTLVPPMLLLKGIPEAVMCQLVLVGWEQSSCVGGEPDGRQLAMGTPTIPPQT